MDTTDPGILFDPDGNCNRCTTFIESTLPKLRSDTANDSKLNSLIAEIKTSGKGKRYDCILGVSGGVDSTYVAYVARKHGLRPLAVHLDNGWNSELAVVNVENTLTKLQIDLETIVLDWEEFAQLQRAFLLASVSDGEVPTDHAIGAALYKVARKHRIKYILSGSNLHTEAILGNWTHGIWDWRYIASIHKRYGNSRLKNFPHYNIWDYFRFTSIDRIKTARILNYMPYEKPVVIDLLKRELNWRPYGGKHHESLYTRFFQGYLLPKKFGIDKRTAHLSNLICTGQISRDAALAELSTPPYDDTLAQKDIQYVLKRLRISSKEFSDIMNTPVRWYDEFPNSLYALKKIKKLIVALQKARLLPRSLAGPI